MNTLIMSTRMALLASAGVALLGLAACGGGGEEKAAEEAAPATPAESAATPAAATATSSPFMPIEMDMKQKMAAAVGPTAEHTWALKMIAHHQGGIDMSQALLQQSPNGPMHEMARKTIDMQTKDRAELEKWVQGHQASGGGGANPFAESEEKMHQRMMAATGPDADRTWALKMIEHHQGSIDMSRRVLQDAKDPEIRRMAQKTIDMQGKEIEELRAKAGAG